MNLEKSSDANGPNQFEGAILIKQETLLVENLGSNWASFTSQNPKSITKFSEKEHRKQGSQTFGISYR